MTQEDDAALLVWQYGEPIHAVVSFGEVPKLDNVGLPWPHQ